MVGRRWENLDEDCLINVFGRVGIESLVLDVPFVCKSWHRASLDPLCWKNLVFPFSYKSFLCRFMQVYGIKVNSCTQFIKFMIDRSHGTATALILPGCCSAEGLMYAAEKCPDLKTLGLYPIICVKQLVVIPQLIGSWKNLEGLVLGKSSDIIEIIFQVGLRCKNFSSLRIHGVRIGVEEASAIVKYLPQLKELQLTFLFIDRENLLIILQGCKELVHLDISESVGFQVDDEILKVTSHTKKFEYNGCSRAQTLHDDVDITRRFMPVKKVSRTMYMQMLLKRCVRFQDFSLPKF